MAARVTLSHFRRTSRALGVLVAVSLGLCAWLAEWLDEPAFAVEKPAPPEESIPAEPVALEGGEGGSAAGEEAAPSRPPVEPFPRAKPTRTPSLEGTLNVLLVGTDRRPGAKWEGRPDTIVVAVFAEDSRRIGLVSVPRDLYVDIPGHGFDRINVAYGVALKNRSDPLELLTRVVETTLLLPIEHSVAVDLGGFETLVDAVGGVDVEVPCAIVDNFVDPREPGGRRLLEVGAGLQHMDGPTAAMYVRSRHGRSDWSRARRQQAVLLGLKRQIFQLGGVRRLPELWERFGTLVRTRMRRIDVLRIATRVSRVDLENVHGLVLDARHAKPFRTPDNKAVLLPEYEAIDRALGELFSAESPGVLPESSRCEDPDAAIRRSYGLRSP